MSAFPVDLNLEAGSDFSLPMVWQIDGVAVDTTGYTARAQARADYGTTSTLLFSLTQASGIALGGANGHIDLTVLAETIAALPTGTIGKWDLLLISPSGRPHRLAAGDVTNAPQVTA